MQSHLYIVIKARKKTMHILPDILSISRSIRERSLCAEQRTKRMHSRKEFVCRSKNKKMWRGRRQLCTVEHRTWLKKNLCAKQRTNICMKGWQLRAEKNTEQIDLHKTAKWIKLGILLIAKALPSWIAAAAAASAARQKKSCMHAVCKNYKVIEKKDHPICLCLWYTSSLLLLLLLQRLQHLNKRFFTGVFFALNSSKLLLAFNCK